MPIDLSNLIIGALIGLGFGVFLQKGRFCFVSAFRDFIAYKDSRVLKGVILGILTMMIGVNVAYSLGTPADHFWIPSFGLNSVIGGFIFGLGMTLAGGCASGSLYRAGEGYLHFWIALLFTGIGYIIFASLFADFFLPYYYLPLQVFEGISPLPSNRGAAPAIAVSVIAVVAGAFVFSTSRSAGRREGSEAKSVLQRLREPWDARVCGIGIGILASIWFAVLTTWSVTGPEARWVGYLLSSIVGSSAVESQVYWSNVVFNNQGLRVTTDMVMLAFLIVGSFAAALWSGDFKIRVSSRRSLPLSIFGGLLMGFGSRMAPGCNISNTFSGLAILSLPSGVATLGLVLGVYAATHWLFKDVGCAI